MDNHFTFAKKNSRDYGLYISGQPYLSGERDIEEISIPGRSGNLTVSNGRIDNMDVTYDCFIKDRLPERTRRIKAWLLSVPPYAVLSDSYQPDYFRYAYCRGAVEFEGFLNRVAQFPLTFRCKPMMYSYLGQKIVKLSKAGSIYNPEAFESRPYIKVYGSGQGTLFINSRSITFKNISSYIELDSESGVIYKDTANMGNTVVISSMPKLQSGINLISWSGKITKIEIIPRWCTA
jgi:phage-related protein